MHGSSTPAPARPVRRFLNRVRSVLPGALPAGLHAQFAPGLVVLGAATLFFGRLGCPLLEPEEARYAEIPREMLAEGSWLVPVLHGQPYLDKPPLHYWSVMTCYALFGVHDWAARLVPALAGSLTVLVVWLWGRRVAGPRAGLLGALVLTLSVGFVYRGGMLTLDGLLMLWVVAGWAAGHAALSSAGRGARGAEREDTPDQPGARATGSSVFCPPPQGGRAEEPARSAGDGMIDESSSSSPLRAPRPAPRASLWALSAVFCGLGLLTKGPVALVLVVPPLFLLPRLDAPLARPGLRDWAAFGVLALAVAAPWFAAVALARPEFAGYFFLVHNVRRFVEPFDHQQPFWYFGPELLLDLLPWTLLLVPLGRRLRREKIALPHGAVEALLMGGWCLLFFSLSGCKRPGYILPALPPLALAVGCALDAAAPRGFGRRGAALAAGWFAVLLAGVAFGLPVYAEKFSLRRQVAEVADLAEGRALFCYPRGWDSVGFYLGRGDVTAFGTEERGRLAEELRAHPGAVLFAKTAHLPELREAMPAGWTLELRVRGGWVTVGVIRREEIP